MWLAWLPASNRALGGAVARILILPWVLWIVGMMLLLLEPNQMQVGFNPAQLLVGFWLGLGILIK